MSENELPPVAFTPSEVQALSAALTAAVTAGATTDPGLRTALRKLAATVVCADERPAQLDLFALSPPAPQVPQAPPTPQSSPISPTDDGPERESAAAGRPQLAVVTALRPTHPLPEPAVPVAPSNVVALRPQTRGDERVVVDDEVRAVVVQAIHDRRVLRIRYTDGRGVTSAREVEPAGLIAAAGKWTLIAWCRSRQEGRGFRLDRVVDAEATTIPAPDRDLASLLGPLGRPAQAR